MNLLKDKHQVKEKKCVASLHKSEISTKSDNELGNALSAFKLKYKGYTFKNIYQSSKVFSDGSQHEELLNVSPKEAKDRAREINLKIIGFRFEGVDYPSTPIHLFYDFKYIKALNENKEVFKELKDYDIFTDIEFNEKKSANTQARACAIYSYLLRNNKVDEYINDIENFKTLY